jgi:hypothetical protein
MTAGGGLRAVSKWRDAGGRFGVQENAQYRSDAIRNASTRAFHL